MDYSANFVFISPWHAMILFKQTSQKKKQQQQQQQILSKFDRNEPKRRSMSSRMIQLSSDFSASSKICGNTSTMKLLTCTRKPHNNDYSQSLGRLSILVDHWGEQERPSNNSVLCREVGEKEATGTGEERRERTRKRSGGGEWWREIVACGKWFDNIFPYVMGCVYCWQLLLFHLLPSLTVVCMTIIKGLFQSSRWLDD